jgi:hypothetical protein
MGRGLFVLAASPSEEEDYLAGLSNTTKDAFVQ